MPGASAKGDLLVAGCAPNLKGLRGISEPQGAVQVWSLGGATIPDLEFPMGGIFAEVSGVALSDDGSMVAAGSERGDLELWQVNPSLHLGIFAHDDSPFLPARSVTGIGFSGDSIAWAAADRVYVAQVGTE